LYIAYNKALEMLYSSILSLSKDFTYKRLTQAATSLTQTNTPKHALSTLNVPTCTLNTITRSLKPKHNNKANQKIKTTAHLQNNRWCYCNHAPDELHHTQT